MLGGVEIGALGNRCGRLSKVCVPLLKYKKLFIAQTQFFNKFSNWMKCTWVAKSLGSGEEVA